jgi:GNAT superfamily N-acetyltransferase
VLTPEPIDPHDPAAFDAWYDAAKEALDDGRPYPTSWSREELRVAVTSPDEYYDRGLWVVRDHGEVAGALRTSLPLKDNTSVLHLSLGVRPRHRRRGAGSALVRVVEELAAQRGRTVLQAEVNAPLTGTCPAQLFARSHGFTLVNTDMHRVLELPLPDGLLETLAAEAAVRHSDYRLRTWQGRCPDELVDAYAHLHSVFATQVPTGDLQWEAEAWDAARIRAREEQIAAQGRHGWTTVAVAADGSLAGHSQLFVASLDPRNVFQWDTLVVPTHRGHRLGLAMKVRNHAELQRDHPQPAVAHTWNAQQNDHMNAVNARLGFRPVELSEQWQRMV